jgi:hypothetical protein
MTIQSEPLKMKSVHCVALKGDQAGGGVAWYGTEEARNAALGSTGAMEEIPFALSVPVNASDDEITELVDSAAWPTT